MPHQALGFGLTTQSRVQLNVAHLKTYILAVVQSERLRRSAPAVVAMERRAQEFAQLKPWIFRQVIKVRREVGALLTAVETGIAVRRCTPRNVVLGGWGHKYTEVRDELISADLPLDRLTALRPADKRHPIWAYFSEWDRAVLLAKAVCRRLYLTRKPRAQRYANVIILHQILVSVFERRDEHEYWIIIGDLSPGLIALATAARAAGMGVITWQYSNLDFKRFPVRPDYAVILNDAGRKLARVDYSGLADVPVFWRPGGAIAEIDLEGLECKPVGALLNVHADWVALNRLSRFHEVIEREILVRLHPNSHLAQLQFPPGLVLAPSDQSLESFLADIGYVICGNTQAQLKALCLGVPVVQCSGLDPLPFDHHEYVRQGVLLGIQQPEEFQIDCLKRFYARGDYRLSVRKILGPEPEDRVPPLSDLIRLLG